PVRYDCLGRPARCLRRFAPRATASAVAAPGHPRRPRQGSPAAVPPAARRRPAECPARVGRPSTSREAIALLPGPPPVSESVAPVVQFQRQPRAAVSPLAPDRALGDAEGGGRLPLVQARVEAQPND